MYPATNLSSEPRLRRKVEGHLFPWRFVKIFYLPIPFEVIYVRRDNSHCNYHRVHIDNIPVQDFSWCLAVILPTQLFTPRNKMESLRRETDQSRTYEGHGLKVVFIAVLRLWTAIKKLYLFCWKKSRGDNTRNMKNNCDQYIVSYINIEYTNMIADLGRRYGIWSNDKK